MTTRSPWKSRVRTVLVLAMLNVVLDVRSGAPPFATLEGVVAVSRKIIEIIEIIETPPDSSVVAPPPTVVITDPEPTTTVQIVPPCFVAASPSEPPLEGCTTVWAVQFVAYNYDHGDIAQAELDQLRKAGMTDLALVDSSVFLSLCPGHLLLIQPTFESKDEATAAALSLQTLASVGTIDIVPLAPDAALRADPDCT
jgi:hypothetical protein